jgi:hypothetical protein
MPLPPQSYATRGAGCVAPSSGTGLTCTLGDLAPGATTTFVVQSAFAAPAGGSYATVATASSGVNDPNPANNRAETTLTVSDARAQRQVGALLVSADSFNDQGGGVTRAAGNVTLGAHFYLPGPDAAFLLNADGTLSGQTGMLTLIAGDYALFRGGFAVDTAALGTPGADVDTSLLTQVAGFDASNGVISAFNLNTGWVTGTVTLALAAGDASGRAPLAFTVQPGPHFSGQTNAPFTVDYGSGAVLRLSELTGRLAAAQGRYALQATGTLTYNLFTNAGLFPGVTLSEFDTADYRGDLFRCGGGSVE